MTRRVAGSDRSAERRCHVVAPIDRVGGPLVGTAEIEEVPAIVVIAHTQGGLVGPVRNC